jgi:ribosome-interacting GTPase 1
MEQDIALLENNIGFFSKSKNAEALIADVREKIARSKRDMAELIEKVRLIDEQEAK